jgi:hypothetical protein
MNSIISPSVCMAFDISLPPSFVRNHTRTCAEMRRAGQDHGTDPRLTQLPEPWNGIGTRHGRATDRRGQHPNPLLKGKTLPRAPVLFLPTLKHSYPRRCAIRIPVSLRTASCSPPARRHAESQDRVATLRRFESATALTDANRDDLGCNLYSIGIHPLDDSSVRRNWNFTLRFTYRPRVE